MKIKFYKIQIQTLLIKKLETNMSFSNIKNKLKQTNTVL